MFLLVPIYPGCPGQKAVKWLLLLSVCDAMHTSMSSFSNWLDVEFFSLHVYSLLDTESQGHRSRVWVRSSKHIMWPVSSQSSIDGSLLSSFMRHFVI